MAKSTTLDSSTIPSINTSRGKIHLSIFTHSNLTRFGYVDFSSLESAKKALDLHGTDYHGRSLVVDTDQGKAKAGYRNRGNWDNHTKYNEKVTKTIKKRKEIEEATSKIKNYNPARKVDRYEIRDKQRALKRQQEAETAQDNADVEANDGGEDSE